MRLRDEGLIECGKATEFEWRWGAIGLRKLLSSAAKARRKLRKTSRIANASRKGRNDAKRIADEAAAEEWARESIRRVVPAVDAEPIRPARPMSIFCMGEAA